MHLTEWLAQTNEIIFQAQQHLRPEQVEQLRMSQQFLMVNHLETGFLTFESQSPFERAMNACPFRKLAAKYPELTASP